MKQKSTPCRYPKCTSASRAAGNRALAATPGIVSKSLQNHLKNIISSPE